MDQLLTTLKNMFPTHHPNFNTVLACLRGSVHLLKLESYLVITHHLSHYSISLYDPVLTDGKT